MFDPGGGISLFSRGGETLVQSVREHSVPRVQCIDTGLVQESKSVVGEKDEDDPP